MKINEVIVVEGKNDTKTLKQYFDCETIETHGSCLSDFTLSLIKKVNETRGIIIFTDPDAPGDKIRNEINQNVPNCKNAFINKNKAKTEKKVGIEHANYNDLKEALDNLITFTDTNDTIGIEDLYTLKLQGNNNSAKYREILSNKYHLGKCNAKQLCKRLNMLSLSKEDIEKDLEDE